MSELVLNLKENKEDIILICEALSNIMRLKILEMLNDEEISHKIIANNLGVTQSAVTFHLASLLDVGIVNEVLGKGLKGRNKKVPILKINKIIINLE